MTSQFTKFLSKIQSFTRWLPIFSKLTFSMQTTFYPNLNSLCFLNILCPFSCSGPLLIPAPPLFLPHIPASLHLINQKGFQPSKTQLRSHFLGKHLPLFWRKVTIFSNLFIPQLQLNCVIIPSTILFFTEYLPKCRRHFLWWQRQNIFCNGPDCE